MPEPDFLVKRGDTASNIASTLTNSAGTAVDIQGAQIRWKMAPLAGGTVTVDDAAANNQNSNGLDGSMGQVLYTWATHPGTAGRYLGEWQVTYAGGSIQSFPNGGYVIVDVVQDL